MINQRNLRVASLHARTLLALFVSACAAGLALPSFATPSPSSGTLSTSNRTLTYSEGNVQAVNPSSLAGDPVCNAPNTCSTFNLTLDPSLSTAASGYDPTQYQITITTQWPATPGTDYDQFVENAAGNVLSANRGTADPTSTVLNATLAAGTYKVINVLPLGAPVGYNVIVKLEPKPPVTALCDPNTEPGGCAPPRYQNYPAGPGQADDAGEPSVDVDWNPNVASLKDIGSPDFITGIKRLNTGGVAFFTSSNHEWRVNFDDCPSPAVNVWEDVSAVFDQQFVLTDPIGFVDHFSSLELGRAYPEPHTPGRLFTMDLIGGEGNSFSAFSDDDGGSYLPGGNGGPGQGPDHETLGGGPYNLNAVPPPPPQPSPYPASGTPNAIYYCSQDIVAEAQCSRSDNGGQTFGPAVPIYDPTVCTGGIHGHVKVARDGTVYVPNSSCGTSGANAGQTGVAVSTDNGITWVEHNVAGSASSQDPSLGIGMNNVGKPSGQTTSTIYLGYVDGDNHPKVAVSHDRGLSWSPPKDLGQGYGVTHAVFPVAVAGDDNRASVGFLGTGDPITTPGAGGTCDVYGSAVNCSNIWHMYIATTYDGGANWIVVDATPDDPVQKGTICLQGTTCPLTPNTRNLLDFNDFTVDAEGRSLLGYADGCPGCNNDFNDGGQSFSSHGTVTRQSGGRRLFQFFDPVEPAAPASPQLVSAVFASNPTGYLLTWLQPDNGGSPITGYNIYRGTSSGAETLLTSVSGADNTKFLDTAPPSTAYYYVTAVNNQGEGGHCGEVTTSVGNSSGSPCTPPYVQVQNGASSVTPDPTGQFTIERVNMGEPFMGCDKKGLTATLKVNTLDPSNTGTAVVPPVSTYIVYFRIPGSANSTGLPQTVFVAYDNTTNPAGEFDFGWIDPGTGGECTTLLLPTDPHPLTGTIAADGTITFNFDFSSQVEFASCKTAATTADEMFIRPELWTPPFQITAIQAKTYQRAGGILTGVRVNRASTSGGGTYAAQGSLACHKVTPIAGLSAAPLSGPAPLTVNFDAGFSHPDVGACGVINSYTLDYGDGTAPVTHTCNITCTPSDASFSHTYSSPGTYPAKLTVGDSAGLTSTNPARAIITVTGGAPVLNGVVSRKTHTGIATPFDITLNPNTPVTIEPRAGGNPTGNHTLVFSFANTLSAVTSVTATATTSGGTQTLPSNQVTGAIGTDTGTGSHPNEYTVTLTGVPNASHVTVTLHGVTDSANNTGDVAQKMDVLYGDANGSGRTDNGDAIVVRNASGSVPTAQTFRADVNCSGRIDNGDAIVIRNNSGTGLP